MRTCQLSDMLFGWFVGNFEPTSFRTSACEVAVKSYLKNDYEMSHYHKIATEITVVVKGRIRMFDKVYEEGAIIVAEPGDVTDFTALEDTVNVVVKVPGVNNDKYVVGELKC